MAREAKLGLVFIGILLTVFSALVIKKMTKKNSLPSMNLNALTAKAGDSGSSGRLPLQSAPATVVKPLSDNTKPPEFASDTTASDKHPDDNWNSAPSQPAKSDTASDFKTKASQPPAVLTEPLAVNDVGDRYKTAVPYHSSYASTDDNHSASTATVRPVQPDASVNPFPRVDATDSTQKTDRTAIAEPTPSYRQAPPPLATVTPTVQNPPTNTLRPQPSSSPSAFSSDSAPANSQRLASRPMPPSTTFTPSTPIASDFTSSSAMSGVIPASAPSTPFQRNGDQYAVQPNDSFWTISQKAYGVGGYFKALYELNRKRTKDSEDLKVGEILTVPDEAIIRRMYPDLCPKPRKMQANTQQRMISASNRVQGAARVYTVVEGDTLFEIARHELGKPSRWGEIYDLNRDILGEEFDYLRPGTELILPESPAGSSTPRSNTATRQPEALYPR